MSSFYHFILKKLYLAPDRVDGFNLEIQKEKTLIFVVQEISTIQAPNFSFSEKCEFKNQDRLIQLYDDKGKVITESGVILGDKEVPIAKDLVQYLNDNKDVIQRYVAQVRPAAEPQVP